MAAKPPRRRTAQRQETRLRKKLVRLTENLAGKAPGGAPDRPLSVTSVSVIEPQVRSLPCPQCGGSLGLLSHGVFPTPTGLLLRLVKAICQHCHAPRSLWFRVSPPLDN